MTVVFFDNKSIKNKGANLAPLFFIDIVRPLKIELYLKLTL